MNKSVLIGIGVVLAAVAVLTTTTFKPKPKLTSDEQQTVTEARAGLEMLAQRSPTAAKLLAFYNRNADQVKYLDEQHFMVVTAPASDSVIFVLARPTTVSMQPNEATVVAGYDGSRRCLSINRTSFNRLVTGLYFGHEISHAQDDIVFHEPYTEPLSPDWLLGEDRAHAAVYTMLNEYTNGAWRTMVLQSVAVRDSIKRSMHKSEQAFIMGAAPGDSLRIVQYFGPLSLNDLSGLSTQMDVDANMMTVHRLAKGNAEIEARGQMAFLDAFYRGNGFTPVTPMP